MLNLIGITPLLVDVGKHSLKRSVTLINYGYFRHRFDAHNNSKLNSLVDEIGIEAYAYYYTLLELYGAKISAQENKNEATIHLRVIANTWRKRIDSCKKVLAKLELSGLLVVTKLELSGDLVGTKCTLSGDLVETKSVSTCTIAIPNFLKYYGSYSKTDRQNVANKRKEKKIKEKKRKEEEAMPCDIGVIEMLKEVPLGNQQTWLKTFNNDSEWINLELLKIYNWLESDKKRSPNNLPNFISRWLFKEFRENYIPKKEREDPDKIGDDAWYEKMTKMGKEFGAI